MPDLELPSDFVNDATFLSAGDLELFREAAVRLDGLSYRSVPCFESTASDESGTPGENTADNGVRMWWGTLEYADGMTTLTWAGVLTKADTERLDLYLNGTLADTVSTSSTFSRTVSIASGYTDGDIIDIVVRVDGHTVGPPVGKTGAYKISAIYGSPVTIASSWPGTPTFSSGASTYPATKLNQLIDAAEWLFDRMNAVPMIPGIAHVWEPMTHKVETRTHKSSWVLRDNSNDILRISGYARIANNEERLKVYVGGSLAYTSPTWTLGTTNEFYVPISLSHTLGTHAEVRLDNEVLDADNQDPDDTENSRYRFELCQSEAGGGGYPKQTPPTAFSGNASIAQATLTSRLNTIATVLANTYTRITTDTALWGRRYACRRRYSYDDKQNGKWTTRYVHWGLRRGDRLRIKGKGIGIGWGGITLETSETEGVLWDKYRFGRSQSITNGEKVEVVDFAFEGQEALDYGTAYYITGTELYYVGEYLV